MNTRLQFVLLFILFTTSIFAQDFFESFDSYTVGDNVSEVSPYLEAWNFNPAVDTKVTNEESYSGENAIRIFNDGGYYTDLALVLSEGNGYQQGIYELKTKMYIQEGKKAYLRLDSDQQGGSVHYTLLCEYGTCMFFNDEAFDLNGTAHDQKFLFGFPYEDNTWFDLELTTYFSSISNTVAVRVDEECYGQFNVGYAFILNSFAGLNLWAFEGVDFFIDDISFKQISDTYEAENHNYVMNVENRIYGETNANFSINGGILFELDLPFNNVSSYTIDLEKDGEVTEYHFDQLVEQKYNDFFCIRPDFQFHSDLDINLRLSKIDDIPLESNGTKCETENRLFFKTVPKERKKGVFIEGIVDNTNSGNIAIEVMLDQLQEKFPNHVSLVSLHNNPADPLPTYVQNIEGLSMFSGFHLIDKNLVPLFLPNFEKLILDLIYSPVKASLRNSAVLDGDNLEIMTQVNAFENIPAGWEIANILIQDNYKGEDSSFDLANIFGEGVNIPIGSCDYKYAPAIIPASEALYDRIPLQYIQDIVVTSAIAANESQTYAIVLNQEGVSDVLEDIKIISLLINANGTVENSKTTSLEKALDIDLTTGIKEKTASASFFSVRNIDNDNLLIEHGEVGLYDILVMNIHGQLILQSTGINTPTKKVDISSLLPGSYVISFIGERGIDSQVIIKH